MGDHEGLETFLGEDRRYAPPAEFRARAGVNTREEYERLYRQSLEDPDGFWREQTKALVFRTPWKEVFEWKLPHAKFFLGATLNVTESCLDRHANTPTWKKPAL